MKRICVYIGEQLGRYGFGEGHPFGPDRQQVFWDYARQQGLADQVCLREPQTIDEMELLWFHSAEYVARVKQYSISGEGYLDPDTPAFHGVYAAAATVVGSTVDAVAQVMSGTCLHAFVPIAGLHHARRDGSAGFCVFNDCGVAIEVLRRKHGVRRVAYVDIDAHHGDGVFYAFEADPDLLYADLHEDGRYLYPGSGFAEETGRGVAKGTKLNIPMPMSADDDDFYGAWERVEAYLERARPEFILLQCGADSIAGDPITHMRYSPQAHFHAALRLSVLAQRYCQGRLVAMGGGGYNRENLAHGWSAILQGLLKGSES